MKANWKIALMCFATLAFVACKDKNAPEGGEGEGGEEEEYVNPISTTDQSDADWKALPQDKVASWECPQDAAYLGLKGVAVYADELYLNILVEYDAEEIIDRAWTPFHVYVNTDNSDLTGGFGDQWDDANTDILMEGAVFADGEPCDYAPEVFAWTGEVGGNGWSWEGLTVAGEFCTTQHLSGNRIEMQMLRELIPTPQGAGWNDSEFSIGFDIQQEWNSVGILPLVSPTDENPAGHTVKLKVKVNK